MLSKKDKEKLEIEYARKKLIMKIGIPVFMILVIIFWVFNLQNSFNLAGWRESDGLEFDWGNINDDFKDNLSDVKEMIGDISLEELVTEKEVSYDIEEKVGDIVSEESALENEPIELTEDEKEEFKADILEKIENDLGKEEICPEYINCMPGPDFEGCQIPAGCEGITIIAY